MLKHAIFIPAMFCVATQVSCKEKPRFSLQCSVRDDTNAPVEGALLTTDYFDYWKPGAGSFGTQVYKTITTETDAKGNAEITGATTICEPIVRATKPGYYWGATGLKSTTHEAGRWQPWNPTCEVLLKRVRNPIPLKAKSVTSVSSQWVDLPADICGYDFDVGDWTAPHGRGLISDIVFSLEGGRFAPDRMRPIGEWRFKITFSAPLDGLVVHDSSKELPSELKMPYSAPESGYLPTMIWHQSSVEGPKVSEKPTYRSSDDYNPREHLFLRVRTQVDANGKIISANYAKVQRGFQWTPLGNIKFQYHYNPNPNDRNLEFDPKRNLFPVPTNLRDRLAQPPPVVEP